MPDIFTSALDKLAEGELDSQTHAVTVGWNKGGYVAAKDMPACTEGLKILVGVLFKMLADGQAGPEG